MLLRTHFIIRLVFLLEMTAHTADALKESEIESVPHYGVDVSYPMHHDSVSTNYAWLPHNQDPLLPVPPQYQGMPIQPLGDRQSFHENFMAGCNEFYKGLRNRCSMNEVARVNMCRDQPASMRNYTKMGFTKIRAPDHVFALLKSFWEKNKNLTDKERWPPGDIYTNHWDSPTRMLSVESSALVGGGFALKEHIWNAARDTIQEWTGQRLVECSLYGIRVYEEGAVLATHVDRLPLVSSAIINVDQDVDEPWPLEVIGHDGKAYNVTMEPGDLVLYESHSVLHGRPFPLKGRFMANVFIHFEPIGAISGPIEYTGDLPPYVIPGSPGEYSWRRSHPEGHTLLLGQTFVTGSTDAHVFASQGDLDRLQALLDGDPNLVNALDARGWTPLLAAVQHGHVGSAELLLERGANANVRAGSQGDGGSPLYYTHKFHKTGNLITFHELKNLLEEYNAKIHDPIHEEL